MKTALFKRNVSVCSKVIKGDKGVRQIMTVDDFWSREGVLILYANDDVIYERPLRCEATIEKWSIVNRRVGQLQTLKVVANFLLSRSLLPYLYSSCGTHAIFKIQGLTVLHNA